MDFSHWGNTAPINWLWAAIMDGELGVFVERGRQYDTEICRIPLEDLQELLDGEGGGKNSLNLGAPKWFGEGRVPRQPPLRASPEGEAKFKAWLTNPSGPMPDGYYLPSSIEQRYECCQLLLASGSVGPWLAALRQQLGLDEPAIVKTGAPGKPSSMHIVLAEFKRRRDANRCKDSRTAEADALAAWLKERHPDAPPCGPKTILNRLPPDFQPQNELLK